MPALHSPISYRARPKRCRLGICSVFHRGMDVTRTTVKEYFTYILVVICRHDESVQMANPIPLPGRRRRQRPNPGTEPGYLSAYRFVPGHPMPRARRCAVRINRHSGSQLLDLPGRGMYVCTCIICMRVDDPRSAAVEHLHIFEGSYSRSLLVLIPAVSRTVV